MAMKESVAEKVLRRIGAEESSKEILMTLLQTKFTSVSEESYREQISNAETPVLKKWIINLLHANTVEDVFRDN